MAESTAALAYARALLEVAVAQGTLDKTRAETESLARMVRASADLRSLFANPTIEDAERIAVLDEIAQRLGLQRNTRNFLMILAERHRLVLLGDICEQFQSLVDAHTGGARARVYSTVPLGTLQLARLKAALENSTGKRVQIEPVVDPSLLGGLRIQIEGRVLDTTLKSQIDSLRDSLLSVA
jgi:F-type H+-transporting ATPase subunit delta